AGSATPASSRPWPGRSNSWAGDGPERGARTTLEHMAFASEHPVVAHSEFRPVGDIRRTEAPFQVVSEFEPAGDQPAAIAELTDRLGRGEKDVVLLGAT